MIIYKALMNQTEPKLTDVEKMNVTSAIDFLVPYVHSIVKISSEVDLPIDDFKKEIIDLCAEFPIYEN